MCQSINNWCYKGVFPDKVTSGDDFIDEAVVKYDVSVVKNTFAVGVGNLQIIENKFWSEYYCTVSKLSLVYSSNFLRSWSI